MFSPLTSVCFYWLVKYITLFEELLFWCSAVWFDVIYNFFFFSNRYAPSCRWTHTGVRSTRRTVTSACWRANCRRGMHLWKSVRMKRWVFFWVFCEWLATLSAFSHFQARLWPGYDIYCVSFSYIFYLFIFYVGCSNMIFRLHTRTVFHHLEYSSNWLGINQ